jgi:hypothetical protein
MQDLYQSQPVLGPGEPRRGAGRLWLWLLLGAGAFAMLVCGGILLAVIYVGISGPETSVYTGNQVPKRYVDIMRDVGALERGETLLYFYSDALTDIRDGFYFVSDKKVVTYSETAGSPLTAIPFEEIADVQLFRNESFFEDSQITLELKDGRPVSFPVSSEYDKDQDFLEAISQRVSQDSDS